jgi:glycosyltransferase involved in cell wall biosynthesis
VRIAVNTRLLIKDKLEGIGWFTFETLRRITSNHPEHEFIFIFDRPWDDSFIFSDNIKPVLIPVPTRHILIFIPWFELLLPYVLRKEKADIFLSPDGHISLLSRVPAIPVIHDLNFEHYPAQLPRLVRWYYRLFFPRFAKKAARIATVSAYTKADIVKQYGVNPDKIDVTYNGCNERYHPLGIAEQETARLTWSDGQPYFIFIGLIIPRKNLVRLLQAFELLKERSNSKVKLLVVGSKKWWDAEHEVTLKNMKHAQDVVFLGRRGADELARLLGSALALTYVPVFEGFGIPILEAFAAGVPVITSSVTSMPEVSGDAALLADPFNPESIAEAMEKVLSNENLRETLREKGLKRKNDFSWDETAERLWQCVEKVIRGHKKTGSD